MQFDWIMNGLMDWQWSTSLAIVGCAVMVLGRHYFGQPNTQNSGCGSCSGCPVKSERLIKLR